MRDSENRALATIRPRQALIEKLLEYIEGDSVKGRLSEPAVVYSNDPIDFEVLQFYYPSILRSNRKQYFENFIDYLENYRSGITENILGSVEFSVDLFNKWWVIELANSVKLEDD